MIPLDPPGPTSRRARTWLNRLAEAMFWFRWTLQLGAIAVLIFSALAANAELTSDIRNDRPFAVRPNPYWQHHPAQIPLFGRG